MAVYEITAPDGSVYEVEGNGTEQEALQAFQAQYKPQQQAAPQPTRGTAVPQQVAADAALSMGSSALLAPAAGLAGLAATPFVGVDGAADLIRKIQGFAYQPRTAEGRAAVELAARPFEMLAQGADVAGQKVADVTGSPAAGAAVNTAVQSIPAALLSRGSVRNGRSSPNGSRSPVATGTPETTSATPAPQGGWAPRLERVPKPSQAVAPTIEELAAQKNAAYQKAEATGVVISRGAINRLKVDLVNDLKKEGLNKKLHPKAQAALEEILNTRGQLGLSQVETLRKIANDAKGSIEPADARLGARIVEKIDDFEDTLGERDVVSGDAAAATAYKEARALNTRLSKARTIEELYRRAELTAPNFSGSGMENALRTEFRALAKNNKQMRRFTAEERAAIEKVAKGGPMENLLRQVGKLAPTGVVSAGMGAMAGATIGGPVGAAMVPAIGFAGRAAATRMTRNNAAATDQLMRAGPTPKPAKPKRNALAETP